MLPYGDCGDQIGLGRHPGGLGSRQRRAGFENQEREVAAADEGYERWIDPAMKGGEIQELRSTVAVRAEELVNRRVVLSPW